MEDFNQICIARTASTLMALMGIKADENIEKPIQEVLKEADKIFTGEQCDRIFMYNPDAIAMWVYEKYQDSFKGLEERIGLKLPMLSVFPPVTPVCFASMYSGMKPDKHGIQKYEKPILKVNTLFDSLPEHGKKVAIVSTEGDSISKIFLNRPIDYYIYGTKQECNDKAIKLIQEDTYHLIVLYNGDYDYYMHRFSPTGKRSLRALKENIETFNLLFDTIKASWKEHNSTIAFAPDHGCHREYLLLGNHRLNETCDMNIMHFYGFLPRKDEKI